MQNFKIIKKRSLILVEKEEGKIKVITCPKRYPTKNNETMKQEHFKNETRINQRKQ